MTLPIKPTDGNSEHILPSQHSFSQAHEQELADVLTAKQSSVFVEKYLREQKISALLDPSQRGKIYDEGNTIFVQIPYNAKIYTFDGNTLKQQGKSYRSIGPCGDFYYAQGDGYTLLDTSGKEVMSLK